ncbi:sulfite exporter TauE/SafE family protein [Chryseolinea sp. T2]|uniref:sulfite exporter TauE/SafE family protein n=1 Tax=Chryseolinea sp. T2 TaxID=3129255 RepID=UPI0030769D53
MYWTALIMGLAGSLHCAGMCSPLVLAATGNGKAMRSRLIYNSGRIMMYGILGAIMGAAGSWLPFDQFRNGFTIIVGLILIVLAIAGTALKIPFAQHLLSKALTYFKRVFASTLKERSTRSTFLLGFLNGMLPCGLTFAALMVALTFGAWQSSVFMIVFGIGTLPVMVGLTSGLNYLIRRFNFSLPRMVSVLLFVSGCLMITRGFVHHEPHAVTSHKHELVDVVLCR